MDALFRSNDSFRSAVRSQEDADVEVLQQRMGRAIDPAERARIGVGQLSRFLEQLLQRRYLENVPAIVPLLEREFRFASAKLASTQASTSIPACLFPYLSSSDATFLLPLLSSSA